MTVNKVYLAPMEGVCDPPMRKVLTHYGEYDECFSEFIRVTTEILPYRTLLRKVPEIETGNVTAYGCPCRLQLLGDNPETVAGTAKLAESLGCGSVDLNFGCPSRFVHHGGAMLLKEPELIREIVARTRDALDPETFLSVKIRTGFLSHAELPGIIEAVAVDGLDEIIIHARTRKDLYRKEALHWPAIAEAKKYAKGIAIVANGDILSLETSRECFEVTGADRQMIGRAVFAKPDLPQIIKGEKRVEEAMTPADVLGAVKELCEELKSRGYPDKACMDRLKQFTGYAHKYDARLSEFFRVFCRAQTPAEGLTLLDDEILRLEKPESEDV